MNFAILYCLVGHFFHGLEPNPVEAKDPSRCCEPKISIGGLLDVEDSTDAVIRSPHPMMEFRHSARRRPCGCLMHIGDKPQHEGHTSQPSHLVQESPHDASAPGCLGRISYALFSAVVTRPRLWPAAWAPAAPMAVSTRSTKSAAPAPSSSPLNSSFSGAASSSLCALVVAGLQTRVFLNAGYPTPSKRSFQFWNTLRNNPTISANARSVASGSKRGPSSRVNACSAGYSNVL